MFSLVLKGSADPLVDSRHDIESISDETKPESTEVSDWNNK